MTAVSTSDIPASAFSSGADLWVAPERKNSRLTQRLDWYLNFQISKSAKHESPPLPPKIEELLLKCELPQLDFKESDRDGLLIPSAQLLPNRWVLVLRGSDQFESWVQNIFLNWMQLSNPSLRVFLPTGKSEDDFQKAWKKISDDQEISLVRDP
jgi:hypothetical protein